MVSKVFAFLCEQDINCKNVVREYNAKALFLSEKAVGA